MNLAATVLIGIALASVGAVMLLSGVLLWGVLFSGAGAAMLVKAFRETGRA